MPSMIVVEFFQDEVQFPYGVLPRATQKSISTSPSWFTPIYLTMEFKTDFFVSIFTPQLIPEYL